MNKIMTAVLQLHLHPAPHFRVACDMGDDTWIAALFNQETETTQRLHDRANGLSMTSRKRFEQSNFLMDHYRRNMLLRPSKTARMQRCPRCNGRGLESHARHRACDTPDCLECSGTGWVDR